MTKLRKRSINDLHSGTLDCNSDAFDVFKVIDERLPHLGWDQEL